MSLSYATVTSFEQIEVRPFGTTIYLSSTHTKKESTISYVVLCHLVICTLLMVTDINIMLSMNMN